MFVISCALTLPAPRDCRSDEQPEVTLDTMSERVWFVHCGWEHMPDSQLLIGWTRESFAPAVTMLTKSVGFKQAFSEETTRLASVA